METSYSLVSIRTNIKEPGSAHIKIEVLVKNHWAKIIEIKYKEGGLILGRVWGKGKEYRLMYRLIENETAASRPQVPLPLPIAT